MFLACSAPEAKNGLGAVPRWTELTDGRQRLDSRKEGEMWANNCTGASECDESVIKGQMR